MKQWEDFLSWLESKIGRNTVNQWLRSLTVVKFDALNLYLEAKDPFQIQWFEEHIRPLALKKLRNPNERLIQIHLSSSTFSNSKKTKNISTFSLSFDQDLLDPTQNFSNYIHSPSCFAYSVLSEYSSGDLYNPIFLFGPKGYGKTHLLISVAHNFQKMGKKVIYVSAQTFTQHVVQAIKFSKMLDFRKVYRNTDILIVDDIHILSKKNATQEEFFHTFNALHTAKIPILLSSNLGPNQLTDIEPRLISRFEWGLTLPLEKPDTQAMTTVLHQKAKEMNLSLNNESINFFLSHFPHLHAQVQAMQAYVLRSGHTRVSVEQAKNLLKDLIEKQAITPEKIIASVAKSYGILPKDILGKAQTKEIAFPRQLSMFLCKKILGLTYTKIGKIYSRDHSTVMSSIKSIQKKLDSHSSEVLSIYKELTKKLEV